MWGGRQGSTEIADGLLVGRESSAGPQHARRLATMSAIGTTQAPRLRLQAGRQLAGAAEDVAGGGRFGTHYKLLNDPVIRQGVVAAAAKRYGHREDRGRLRLYAGRLA
jgi:hypothetical protein